MEWHYNLSKQHLPLTPCIFLPSGSNFCALFQQLGKKSVFRSWDLMFCNHRSKRRDRKKDHSIRTSTSDHNEMESFRKVCQFMQLKWTYMALNILLEYLFLNRLCVFFTYIFQDISGVLWKQNWSQSIVIVLS